MDSATFRRLGHRLVDWVADYREHLEARPVMSQVAPGEIRKRFPTSPPEEGGRMEDALAALDRDVLPGITGLAQVSGRNNLSWEEKFALDVQYVNQWSLWLDLKVLLMTVRAVTAAEGVSAPSQIGSPEFTGTADARRDEEEAA